VKVKAIPEGYEGATPSLIIKDAARALEFYKKAFGATEIMCIPSPGGRVGHAEINIGAAIIMLAD
jgi:PhnB protein